MGHFHVKLYESWTSGSKGDAVKEKVTHRLTDGQWTDQTNHNSSP